MKCFFSILLICLSAFALAQSSPTVVTDEELQRYVIAMDSINQLTEQLKQTLSDLIKNNPGITPARYNELSQLNGDSLKLKGAKATPAELKALKEINERRTAETLKLQEALKKLAAEYVGAATYNKIRNALRTDTELKNRYDAMMAQRKKSG
ncbi:MAG: hypothetical protein NZM13_10365 [Cyclobacteriaceae bacterium]|nr:hypothetical protein [Cyclobacteriaceae bacterium]MDW8332180.1 hypothetical protein [Cyclobacteriaceae bacterium]